MKKIILIFVLSITFQACAKSQPSNTKHTMQQTDKQTEQTVANTVRELTKLMISRDINALETLLDKNFTLTHITGRVQPKADWLEEIRSESMKYYGYKEVQMSVKIDGNKATVTNRNLLDARIWGSRNEWRLQQVLTLEKQGDKWVILKSVATTF
ncbi:MAG: nuclear transport factor 2 family protein [Capnocytophaga sp.]|nr:nuclear transport factor 2 family protein [Capnocytophaga sp.]